MDASVDTGPPDEQFARHRSVGLHSVNHLDGSMALDGNALGSISYSLDDLIERIGELADRANDEDEALIELREVERQLHTSARRLTKIVRRVSRS